MHTARIRLVPLGEEHLDLEVAMDADPEVMRYITGDGRTREQVEAGHRMRMKTAEPVPGLGFWVGFVDDEFVGWWLLEPAGWAEGELVPGEVELGYRLLRAQWGKGLASEGAREMLRHAFEDLGMHRVFAYTMAVNERSRATAASVGMTYVRTFHDPDFEGPAGSEHGDVEYSITRDEWQAAR